jgi:hypothetical protein
LQHLLLSDVVADEVAVAIGAATDLLPEDALDLLSAGITLFCCCFFPLFS